MGIPDSSLLDLLEKVGSCISWRRSDTNSMSCKPEFIDNNLNMCCCCQVKISNSCFKFHCLNCGKLLCSKCVEVHGVFDIVASSRMKEVLEVNIDSCRFCNELSTASKGAQRCDDSCFPSFCGERVDHHSSDAMNRNSHGSFSDDAYPVPGHRSPSRSDEDESHSFSEASEYIHDASDVDSVYSSAREELYSLRSFGSSSSDSPSRINFNSNRVGRRVQQKHSKSKQAILEKPVKHVWDMESIDILDYETNHLIWIPPPPSDLDDEVENNFFTYDNEDDDFGAAFPSMDSLDSMLSLKEKQRTDFKEPLRSVVQGHFRVLVLQLLQGEGIPRKENDDEDWLNIITTIAWQAANFIKPDTSGGGSMDPGDYVKVKCVASGNPSDSKFIKGVVCTKNIKHKRMIAQYRNSRMLLLGGPLEYQRVPNQLASFETLLQQENDHLKTIVSKIEAHRPNVLLVEKSVSSFAQDLLLEKEISLVLNVKRPLLDRIARCSGATVTPSIDHISATRLGHCEFFHLERLSEDHEPVNQFNRRPSKTLMFFEGCPRRLGCTVVLRGSSREELKKVKKVVQYAVFAAYNLSLETSFLADEGASLPKIGPKSSIKPISICDTMATTSYGEEVDVCRVSAGSADLNLELGLQESLYELGEAENDDVPVLDVYRYRKALSDACDENLALNLTCDDEKRTCLSIRTRTPIESLGQVASDAEASSEYYSANENSQSILVSFSSRCILNGTVCERSRLLRVKFYGPSDKPLGRYLRDDLFDQFSRCHSCKESADAHSICYTHQRGNLMINVRRLSTMKLPGEQDGKIWMWHRCLRCTCVDGVPPATARVVMSDVAWGLSFGKFLELCFSDHATGNRVAGCGHSLQKDCLRFYGFGAMVASFRYSPINILSVHLPPSILESSCPQEQTWIRNEASELLRKAKAMHTEIATVLQEINSKSLSSMSEFSDASDLHSRVLELIDILAKEKEYYEDLLRLPDTEILEQSRTEVDILEINRLWHSLLVDFHFWNKQLYLLDSIPLRTSVVKAPQDIGLKDSETDSGNENNKLDYLELDECSSEAETTSRNEGNGVDNISSACAAILSNKIDSAWSGTDLSTMKSDVLNIDASEAAMLGKMIEKDHPPVRRLLSPTRVYSFDSAQRFQERMTKVLPPSLHLQTLRSFHASGDYAYMIRDPVPNVQRTYAQTMLNLRSSASPSSISFAPLLPKGARLMVPQNGQFDIVVAVHDNEPTSIISYALCSKKYVDWIADKPNADPISNISSINSDLSTWASFGSLDFDYIHYGSYSSDDAPARVGVVDPKSSPHLRVSFEDDSSTGGKVKFSVTCYFAKQFDSFRRRCYPSEVDFMRSMSRCKQWSAQGGKSNVYFAKTFDERFIIKQVTKTELESFNEFAPQYFKYFTNAFNSKCPTCLAKILGIYEVTVRNMKDGKETKINLMVMENLFFKRNISKVYDLKGSERSRYNADTMGANKVLLDMNLLETLRTNPMFLGSKAKRSLERAIWNDTSFLTSVDVMDYSLLVGVDEERKELVVGIIDYMRQYTWDKHLETWVKASGILGGPKNASPTIISPKQYKKRFRKAMTTYFQSMPDQRTS